MNQGKINVSLSFHPHHAIAGRGFGRIHPGGPSLTFQDPPAAADASLVAGAYRLEKTAEMRAAGCATTKR